MLKDHYKITIRFKSETPTLRLIVEEGENSRQNLATIQTTFESRDDCKNIVVRRIGQTAHVVYSSNPEIGLGASFYSYAPLATPKKDS